MSEVSLAFQEESGVLAELDIEDTFSDWVMEASSRYDEAFVQFLDEFCGNLDDFFAQLDQKVDCCIDQL
jgi:DNA-binding SARP family transcriptional activator